MYKYVEIRRRASGIKLITFGELRLVLLRDYIENWVGSRIALAILRLPVLSRPFYRLTKPRSPVGESLDIGILDVSA